MSIVRRRMFRMTLAFFTACTLAIVLLSIKWGPQLSTSNVIACLQNGQLIVEWGEYVTYRKYVTDTFRMNRLIPAFYFEHEVRLGKSGTISIPGIYVCVVLGVLWVISGRRAVRGRESTLCENCAYDLTGNASGRCPECGASTSIGDKPRLESRGECSMSDGDLLPKR